VLLILRFIPVLGGIIALIGAIWRIITGFVAVREALDFDSGKAVATIILGFIGYIIVAAIVALILGALGLGAAALTGGL
jgi:uncharacterized protein involved in cysteine biosynthesis